MTTTIADITQTLSSQQTDGAAVLIPLIERPDGLHVLFEVRALSLNVQPGEVCLPGGRIERDETPEEAAVRETCEELLLTEEAIRVIGTLGSTEGPGGRALWVFVGVLDAYVGTSSPDEVDHTFSVPLDWFLTHEPTCYAIEQSPIFPEDLPWDRIPGGRAYPWRSRAHEVPFYLETEPLIWGITARIMQRFSRLLKQTY